MGTQKGEKQDLNHEEMNRRNFLKTGTMALAAVGALGLVPEMSRVISKSRHSGVAYAGESPKYEVYALKYGEMQNFSNILWFWLGNPPLQPQQEITTKGAYYWLIKGPDLNLLFDTGTTPEVAKAHHIANYEDHTTVLGKLDLKIDDIEALIISHAHFDHINGAQVFKKKDLPIYVQEACYKSAVEEYPAYPLLKSSGMPAWTDIEWLTEQLWAGRLRLVQGERGGGPIDIVPGVSVRRVDGHMKGLQIVTVQTAQGAVVLTSDAAYLYANLDLNWPGGLYLGSLTDAMDGLRLSKESGQILVPGHDVEVEKRFPEVKPGIFKVA